MNIYKECRIFEFLQLLMALRFMQYIEFLTSKPVGFMQSCSRWLPSSCLSCRISCSTTPIIMCTSSAHAHCPHVIRTCHPHLHIVHIHKCHPHIICSTPHGQRGPKLSFYSDRIWLLNGICLKNVELFHFRII